MQKIETRKPVKGTSSREKGGSWFLGLNEDPLEKVEGLDGRELDGMQLGIHRRLSELRDELDQMTQHMGQRRPAPKESRRVSLEKLEHHVSKN